MSLLRAIEVCGSASALADRCGVSLQNVTNWKARGLPYDQVLTIAAATGWRVTPHDLRPDIYPNPTDGLPPDQRKRAA